MTVLETPSPVPAVQRPPAPEEFLAGLKCPSCRGAIQLTKRLPADVPEIRYGLLACSCSAYPIVEGIAVVRHAAAGERVDFARAMQCIERGDAAGALAWCLAGSVGSPRRPILGAMERLLPRRWRPRVHHLRGALNRRALSQRGLTFRDALGRVKANLFREYLYQRFANPSLHAAVPVIAMLKELRGTKVLDLACGTGHSTFLIKSLFPNLSVVMADHDFTNLLLARRFMSPNSPAVCLDAEAPLPFDDHAFDAAFCMDAFHYIASKAALAQELDRVVEPDGMLLLPHLHNALANNPVPGTPLTPAQYLELFSTRDVRAFSEPQLLGDFVRSGTVDLSRRAEPQTLDQANAVSIVAGAAERLWQSHDVLDLYLNARPLGLNPLYRVERGAPVDLQMEWPDPQLKEECQAVLDYMPASRRFNPAMWDRITTGGRQPADRAAIEAMQKEFMIVPLPVDYGSVALKDVQ